MAGESSYAAAPSHGMRARVASHRAVRDRRRRLASPKKRARRRAAGKTAACALVITAFLALALVVGDSDYHVTPIGWVPFFVVLTAIALAFCYLQVLKRCLLFSEQSDMTDCERDSDVRFTVHFRNRSPLFYFRIEAYFYVSDLFGNVASEAMTTLSLSPREEYDLGFSTSFEHIGTYEAGLDRVVVTDFLGLFTATLSNARRRRVNVTPKVQTIRDGLRFSNDALNESTKSAKSVLADSMDYAHVREYVIGDPLKTIHWKLSARSDHYLTRLYEVYTNPGVTIFMDFYGPSDEARELMGMFDAVVESAFSIGRFARERGMEANVVFHDKQGKRQTIEQWRRDDMAALIDEMPAMSNDPADQVAVIRALDETTSVRAGHNNIVVCSANVGSEMVSTVIETKLRHRSPLFVAVVPRDIVGRERDAYCSALSRLDASDIPYIVLSKSDELGEGAS